MKVTSPPTNIAISFRGHIDIVAPQRSERIIALFAQILKLNDDLIAENHGMNIDRDPKRIRQNETLGTRSDVYAVNKGDTEDCLHKRSLDAKDVAVSPDEVVLGSCVCWPILEAIGQ